MFPQRLFPNTILFSGILRLDDEAWRIRLNSKNSSTGTVTLLTTKPTSAAVVPETDEDEALLRAGEKMVGHRKWDFSLGKFILTAEPVITDEEQSISRQKRQTSNSLPEEAFLELGIVIDYSLWNLYVVRYGADKAENYLNNYLDAILDTTQLLWRLDSVTPNLKFNIAKVDIWKEQAEELNLTAGKEFAFITEFSGVVRSWGPPAVGKPKPR